MKTLLKPLILLIVLSVCCTTIMVSIMTDSNRIIFCDVGQGDAILIRLFQSITILVDAGPNKSVIDCLNSSLPFYDRTIDFAIMSHFDKDHIGGFEFVLQKFKVETVIELPLWDNTSTARDLQETIQKQQIKTQTLFANETIRLPQDTSLETLWPSRAFLDSNTSYTSNMPTLKPQLPLNDYSYVMLLRTKNTKVLLTGDAPSFVLEPILQKIGRVPILKLSHHGSYTGTSAYLLQLADPTLAVISAGKKNKYGHPSQIVLDLLKALKINYARTDENGAIMLPL